MNAPTAVLVDTGPLIAIVDKSDSAHNDCIRALKDFSHRTKLCTTESVLTEAFYLLSSVNGGQDKLFELLRVLNVALCPVRNSHLRRAQDLMATYSNLPMDFADAALVTIAEELKIKTIFSLDRRGFKVYRPQHIKSFLLVP